MSVLSDPTWVMEEPALWEELGAVAGLRVLDLGCGDAAIGLRLLGAGASSYHGIDRSERMVAAARGTLRGSAGVVELGDVAEVALPPADLVLSRLALHYVADLDRVLGCCAAALAPGGRVVFTVLHPIITAHDARASSDEPRTSWVVDDYFSPGPRERELLGEPVVWHHRTVESYVSALLGAGFSLTALRECEPRRERFSGDDAEWARRRRIPLFLLLAGTRR